jgi:predicted phosphodiesterase
LIARPKAAEIVRVRRVGLIGDVHSERARLAHVLARLSRMDVDRILCTGDVPDGPHDTRAVEACCALLAEHGVLTISGNHDRWLQDGEMRDLPGATDHEDIAPSALAYLSALPATRELDTPLGKALLCHGMGDDDMAAVQPFDHGHALESNEALQSILRERRYQYVISGHTHRAMVRVIGSLTVINAGTLLTGQNPCWSVLDFDKRSIQFHEIADDGSSSASSEWSI